jgi:flavin-dependent dehydrogenase
MITSLSHDALIVGGGLAGSALATSVSRGGRQVVLIEKTREAHHKVCGEFLSPECLPLLHRLGIHPESLGAQTIHAMRIAARDVLAEVSLPSPALSLTRYTLDSALLQSAQRQGASVLRGYSVERLSHHANSGSERQWHAQISSGTQEVVSMQGADVFLATGKHDLRGWTRETSSSQNALVAMKSYFVLSPAQRAALAGHVELLLYPGGYAGLQPVEDGRANLCALITRDKLLSLGGRWERLLEHMKRHSSHLDRRLSGAIQVLDRPLALSAIPYGYCTPTSIDVPSPWRLGDQAAVIPSFCGEGMAIALHTADLAARMYLSGNSAMSFHATVRRQFERRLHRATILSRLIIAAPSLAQAVRLWPSILGEIFNATRLPQSYLGGGEAIQSRTR